MASPSRVTLVLVAVFGLAGAPASAAAPRRPPRNVVIFVADGLRPGSIDVTRAPALAHLRDTGVWFANSHSLYPTLTTPNASAIATGHMLGDTGDFGNVLYTGFPVFDRGSFAGTTPGTATPFIEDDQVLGDLDTHFPGGSFLGEQTLLSIARAHGLNTAVVGKLGPVLIQDVTAGAPHDRKVPVPRTVVIDDRTGSATGIPLPPAIAAALQAADLPTQTPDRGTTPVNYNQQKFFVDAVTRAVLPEFKKSGKPFVLVYWSRDPDGTQHNNGDSLWRLSPGINGPTSALAVGNADHNLKQILDYIAADPALAGTTDVLVTSDHGFSTLSRRDLDASGTASTCGAARRTYRDLSGNAEFTPGALPPGFLAIDLATELGLPMFDPDTQVETAPGKKSYARVDCACDRPTAEVLQRPRSGSGLIGGTGAVRAPTDAKVVVAVNGGSDLIYVPDLDKELIARVAAFLLRQDYVDGVFADERAGEIPGTLPLAAINLKGKARTPVPTLVVALKSFCLDPSDPIETAVEISDTVLQLGQGMHGSFGRADTLNTMLAAGPDFKKGFVDRAPAGNADVAMTAYKLLDIVPPSRGKLRGRALTEAFAGKPDALPSTCGVAASTPGPLGMRTWLHFQEAAGVKYLDAAKKAANDPGWESWADDLPCAGPKPKAAAP